MGVCHVHRRTFIADIDDANALPCNVIPDRLNMTSLQTENTIDAARFQETRNPGRAGLRIGVEVLGFVRRLTHSHSLSAQLDAELCCARSTRWRIFPVAVLGMSSSRTNDTDLGRL